MLLANKPITIIFLLKVSSLFILFFVDFRVAYLIVVGYSLNWLINLLASSEKSNPEEKLSPNESQAKFRQTIKAFGIVLALWISLLVIYLIWGDSLATF